MGIEEVYSGVFGFNPSTWRDTALHLIPQPQRWLLNSDASWLHPRHTDEIDTTNTQTIVLYAGEMGTGKTTQLDYDARRLEKDPRNVVLTIDLTHAGELADCRKQQFAKRLWRLLRNAIELKMDALGLTDEYDAEVLRQTLTAGQSREINRIRSKYGHQSTKHYSEMSPEEILGNAEIRKAVAGYESHSGDSHFALLAVQHLEDKRAILLIDNVDHLMQDRVSLLFGALSHSIHTDTLLCVAVRPENLTAIEILRHGRPTRERNFNAIDGTVYSVIRTRAKGAVAYFQANEPQSVDAAQQFRRRITDLASAVEGDKQASSLLQQWQNGDLRQILPFMLRASLKQVDVHRPTSVRGVIYSELIQSSMPEHMLGIFDPARVPSSRYEHPFVLLDLRILAYLDRLDRHARGPVSEKRILGDFRARFGISPEIVRSALDGLCGQPLASGKLVRREGKFGDNAVNYLLLPAGRVFIRQIVQSCDFLSWVYDRSKGRNLPLIVDQDFPSRSQLKLEKAVAVIDKLLYPTFVDEHPYMEEGYRAKDLAKDVERLHQYRQMFGYGPNSWFILALLRELTDYAANRSLDRTSLNLLDRKLTKAARLLDKISERATPS